MTTTDPITNQDNIIDSRDIIARIAALVDARDELQTTRDETDPNEQPAAYQVAVAALQAWHEDEGAELAALQAVADEAEGYAADWPYGEALIRDSYFKTYAQELAEDIGAIKAEIQWPYTCIDWDWAVRELQHDYTTVDFAGVRYWIR